MRAVAGLQDLPGRETFSRQATAAEIEGAGRVARPAPAISTKNKHLMAIYAIPTRGFTAAVSVFKGTPPTKPFDCKIGC